MMKTFIGVVHKDDDSAWGISFPDLPGCFSAADDLDDLMPAAAEALALWFEDQPTVEPRGMEAIRTAAAADLAEGAMLLAVPLISNAGKPVRVNLSLDRSTLDAARNEIQGAH